MKFWQNQLNFAIWTSTTGCGISMYDHLLSDNKMISSFYLFHVYYQTRKILNQLRCALPSETSWSAYDNGIDMTTYEQICNEFMVSQNANFRQQYSKNNGLGTIYIYWSNKGYHELKWPYNITKMSFTQKTTNEIMHIDYIAQGSEAEDAWMSFILDHSKGFTRAGVERINDSVRVYCWAILGAQVQTRTSIVGIGPAFDSQKQFLSNVEDAISKAEDLPSSIKHYQDVLRYARSKLDFVLGESLYMIPSNMQLKIGKIDSYNNEIVVATGEMLLGVNEKLNVEKRDVPIRLELPIKQTLPKAVVDTSHEQNKALLVIGATGIGLIYYLSTRNVH
jgi:hypothetical protein